MREKRRWLEVGLVAVLTAMPPGAAVDAGLAGTWGVEERSWGLPWAPGNGPGAAAPRVLPSGSGLAPLVWTRVEDAGPSDDAGGVAVSAAGSVVAVGRSFPKGEVFVLKYLANGDVAWRRALDQQGPGGRIGVAISVLGDIAVAGPVAPEGLSDLRPFVARLDKDGNLLWARVHDVGYYSWASGVAFDSKDNIVVAGTTAGFQALVAKFDPLGNLLFGALTDSCCYTGNAVAVAPDDTILVAGQYSGTGGAYVLRVAPTGAILAQTDVRLGAYSVGMGISADLQGISLGGSTCASWAPGCLDVLAARLGHDGAVLWARAVDLGGDVNVRNAAGDAAGQLYVAGWTGASHRAFLAKVGGNGDLAWSMALPTDGLSEEGHAVGVDPLGHPALASERNNAGGSSDLVVRRFLDASQDQLAPGSPQAPGVPVPGLGPRPLPGPTPP